MQKLFVTSSFHLPSTCTLQKLIITYMEYTDDSDDINEWQLIEHHPSPETFQTPSLGWNMVVVNENYLQEQVDQSSSSIEDPPTNEEDSLQIVPATMNPEDGTSSTSEGAAAPPSCWRLRVANEGRMLLKLRLEAMRNGVVRVASKVRNCAVCAGAFWSITCVTGAAAAAAAVLMAVVYVGVRRRRRRVHRQSVEGLVYLLREKDELLSLGVVSLVVVVIYSMDMIRSILQDKALIRKTLSYIYLVQKISQLLVQIAQLNEALSSRRKVPVLRISS